MCGEAMRLIERETTDRLPGSQQSTVTNAGEWTCPECDYFEEAGTGGDE
jgi:hypothetical protein